ncbi:type III secretion system export apparatus subunit SctR [Endozoicomonas sp. Mp262]|uniref:type III secretion system export apparatus subunit SctR n=1 Tax=Endozoicomonas sp. Mp262 TaxID=2919499 RepID=UPI0021DACC58
MNGLPDPVTLITGLLALSLIPFMAVMATSFIKLTVVFSLVRNALGIQQIPPNIALYGMAIILSLYIMAPVGFAVYDYWESHDISLENKTSVVDFWNEGLTPVRGFLQSHTRPREIAFFQDTATNLWPENYSKRLDKDSLLILLPSYTVSELTLAFEIGFLLYLPFIAIDLIVSNVLLAMGMMMVSPMTISLPFKLLLFVLVDGWTRLIHGLVGSYF